VFAVQFEDEKDWNYIGGALNCVFAYTHKSIVVIITKSVHENLNKLVSFISLPPTENFFITRIL
jgi:hypothetical protein